MGTPEDRGDHELAAATDLAGSFTLERFRPYLHLLAEHQIGRRLAGRVDASDIVQETFLRATRNLAAFAQGQVSDGHLTAWLRRILASVLADAIRRHCLAQCRDVRLEQHLESALHTTAQRLDRNLASAASSPSQQVSREEQTLLLADALANLEPVQRDILILRHMENCSFAEIAQRMGRSASAVKQLWVLGLAELRQCMEGGSHGR